MNSFLLFRNITSTLPAASMAPSPSFPTQLSSNKSAMAASSTLSNPATQSSLNLNNSFLGGLGQNSNTAKRLPMNQMLSSTQSTFVAAQPSQFQNSANSLSTLSPIVANQSNSVKRNGQESTIALSAQEINDFLS